MLSSYINMQTSVQLATQFVLWQHTFHSMFNQSFRVLLTNANRRVLTLTTWKTRVRKKNTVSPLFTSQLDFLSIDHDYMIATIYVRRIAGFVLAANDFRHLASHTAQYLVFCIYQNPVLFNRCLVSMSGLKT